MLPTRKRHAMVAMSVAAAMVPWGPALYATVTVGGSSSSPYIWANPFVGGGSPNYATTYGFGTTPATTPTVSSGAGLVDRTAARYVSEVSADVQGSAVYVPRDIDGTTHYTGSAWLQDTLNSGTFTTSGVISVQHYYPSWTGSKPYTVSLGGTPVQGPTLGNATSSDKFQLTLFASPLTANSVRVDFASLATQTANTRSYAGVQETLLLPVVGNQIPVASFGVTDTGHTTTFVATTIVDNSDSTFFLMKSASSTITVDLGTVGSNDTFNLGTLVVTGINNYYASFTLSGSSDGGSSYSPLLGGLTVQMGTYGVSVENTNLDIAVLSVNAAGLDHIRFTTNADTGIAEIFAFQPFPEPAAMSLLALGGLVFLRRRNR